MVLFEKLVNIKIVLEIENMIDDNKGSLEFFLINDWKETRKVHGIKIRNFFNSSWITNSKWAFSLFESVFSLSFSS